MLKDPPVLEIKRTWSRPNLDLLTRFDGAQSGHLVDAMSGRGGLSAAIKPLLPEAAHFIGTALPVATGPNDNLAILAGVAKASPGDVIVAASDRFEGSAVCGDIVAMLAKNAGCAGIVIDGMARDLIGIEGVGLPVFARGVTPNSCVKSGPGRVGFPIAIGDVPVAPGDIVMGDRDGVVIVPQARLDEVIASVEAIRAAESKVIAEVEQGLTAFAAIEEMLNSDRVTYVD
ncbi:MAG: RraA family protein [Pseudomonadota bacterium]